MSNYLQERTPERLQVPLNKALAKWDNRYDLGEQITVLTKNLWGYVSRMV
jgi:hypothetical protein